MKLFKLDEQLKQDTLKVVSGPLSEILLMNDRRYPWLIQVPRLGGITELYQLTEAQQCQLAAESMSISKVLVALYKPKKMNVAAIGNIVSQLHIHHVARFEDDFAWPAPVWGRGAAEPYSTSDSAQITLEISGALAKQLDLPLI